ncbi:MAG: acetylxylan esterase, partial [Acidobacteriaceae bacterium]
MRWSVRLTPEILCAGMVAAAFHPLALAQSSPGAGLPPPVNFTADQDHRNMMDQLGIEALRPGPSGDEAAPNHANYDESKADPYPNLPDPLTLNDGQKVTTAAMWWDKRRPQIVDMYEKYVYGRIPNDVPPVHWTVGIADHERLGFTPVIAKELIGRVDNSSYPAISVNIHMILVTPVDVKGPVPVLIMFGRSAFPNPSEPSTEEIERVNQAWKTLLIHQDPSLQATFEQHPAWQLVKGTPFQFPQLNADGGLPNTWQLVADGWGFVLLDPASVQADDGAGLTRGIIGLVNKGQPR